MGKECLPLYLETFSSRSKSLLVKESIEGVPYLYSKEEGRLIFVRRDVVLFTIPSNIQIIDCYAFGRCDKLSETFNVPKNVIEIRENAFWNASVKTINIEGYKCQLSESSLVVGHSWGRKYINGYTSIKRLIVPYGRCKYYKKQLSGSIIEICEAKSLKSLYLKEFYMAGKVKDKYGVIYNEDKTVLLRVDLSFN